MLLQVPLRPRHGWRRSRPAPYTLLILHKSRMRKRARTYSVQGAIRDGRPYLCAINDLHFGSSWSAFFVVHEEAANSRWGRWPDLYPRYPALGPASRTITREDAARQLPGFKRQAVAAVGADLNPSDNSTIETTVIRRRAASLPSCQTPARQDLTHFSIRCRPNLNCSSQNCGPVQTRTNLRKSRS